MPNGRGTQDASGASAVATAAILTSSESRSESSTNRVDNAELVSEHAPSTIYYHNVVSQPTMFKPGKDIDAWIAKFNVYVRAANVRNKYSLLLTLVDDECVRKLTSSIQEGDEESCFEQAVVYLKRFYSKANMPVRSPASVLTEKANRK
jgi:hypothetical protein